MHGRGIEAQRRERGHEPQRRELRAPLVRRRGIVRPDGHDAVAVADDQALRRRVRGLQGVHGVDGRRVRVVRVDVAANDAVQGVPAPEVERAGDGGRHAREGPVVQRLRAHHCRLLAGLAPDRLLALEVAPRQQPELHVVLAARHDHVHEVLLFLVVGARGRRQRSAGLRRGREARGVHLAARGARLLAPCARAGRALRGGPGRGGGPGASAGARVLGEAEAEHLALVGGAGAEQAVLAPVVDGDGVVIIEADGGEEVAAAVEGEQRDAARVEALEARLHLHALHVPDDDLGRAPDLARCAGAAPGVHGQAQHVVGVHALHEALRVGALAVDDAERRGHEHEVPGSGVAKVVAAVAAPVAVHPAQVQVHVRGAAVGRVARAVGGLHDGAEPGLDGGELVAGAAAALELRHLQELGLRLALARGLEERGARDLVAADLLVEHAVHLVLSDVLGVLLLGRVVLERVLPLEHAQVPAAGGEKEARVPREPNVGDVAGVARIAQEEGVGRGAGEGEELDAAEVVPRGEHARVRAEVHGVHVVPGAARRPDTLHLPAERAARRLPGDVAQQRRRRGLVAPVVPVLEVHLLAGGPQHTAVLRPVQVRDGGAVPAADAAPRELDVARRGRARHRVEVDVGVAGADGEQPPRGVELHVGDGALRVAHARQDVHGALAGADGDAAGLGGDGRRVQQRDGAVDHAHREHVAAGGVAERAGAGGQVPRAQLHAPPQRPDAHRVVIAAGGELRHARVRAQAPELAAVVPAHEQRQGVLVGVAVDGHIDVELVDLRGAGAHEHALAQHVHGGHGAGAVAQRGGGRVGVGALGGGVGVGREVQRVANVRELPIPADDEAVLAAGEHAAGGWALAHRIHALVDAVGLHDLHELPRGAEAVELAGGAANDGVVADEGHAQERLHLAGVAEHAAATGQRAAAHLEELDAALPDGHDLAVVGVEGHGEQLRLVALARGEQLRLAPVVHGDGVVCVEPHAHGARAVAAEGDEADAARVEAGDVGLALEGVRVPDLDGRPPAHLARRHERGLRVHAHAEHVVRVPRVEALGMAQRVVDHGERRRGVHHERLHVHAAVGRRLHLRLRRRHVPHVVAAVRRPEAVHPLQLQVRVGAAPDVRVLRVVRRLEVAEALRDGVRREELGRAVVAGAVGALGGGLPGALVAGVLRVVVLAVGLLGRRAVAHGALHLDGLVLLEVELLGGVGLVAGGREGHGLREPVQALEAAHDLAVAARPGDELLEGDLVALVRVRHIEGLRREALEHDKRGLDVARRPREPHHAADGALHHDHHLLPPQRGVQVEVIELEAEPRLLLEGRAAGQRQAPDQLQAVDAPVAVVVQHLEELLQRRRARGRLLERHHAVELGLHQREPEDLLEEALVQLAHVVDAPLGELLRLALQRLHVVQAQAVAARRRRAHGRCWPQPRRAAGGASAPRGEG
mmetsp:Transcript_37760/g.118213  ORF Transcript_37760/g.118213 Transcript_37760/m.118213 type:complete len:1436 (+) Transcript_37760:1501-5808(+)